MVNKFYGKSISYFIEAHKDKNPNSYYFSKGALKFFGEKLSEMRILKSTVVIKDLMGELHQCYVMSSVQHKYPNGATRHYTYFDVETLEEVWSSMEKY